MNHDGDDSQYGPNERELDHLVFIKGPYGRKGRFSLCYGVYQIGDV